MCVCVRCSFGTITHHLCNKVSVSELLDFAGRVDTFSDAARVLNESATVSADAEAAVPPVTLSGLVKTPKVVSFYTYSPIYSTLVRSPLPV